VIYQTQMKNHRSTSSR